MDVPPESSIFSSVITGDIDTLRTKLEEGSLSFDLDQRDAIGWPCIFYAVQNDDLPMFLTLVDAGADLSLTSRDHLISRLVAIAGGMNILHIAGMFGSLSIVSHLFTQSNELTRNVVESLKLQVDNDGLYPRQIALIYRRNDVVEYLSDSRLLIYDLSSACSIDGDIETKESYQKRMTDRIHFEQGEALRQKKTSQNKSTSAPCDRAALGLQNPKDEEGEASRKKSICGNEEFQTFLTLISALDISGDNRGSQNEDNNVETVAMHNFQTWCMTHNLEESFYTSPDISHREVVEVAEGAKCRTEACEKAQEQNKKGVVQFKDIGSPVYLATVYDSPIAIEILLNYGADGNKKTTTGDSPLLHCCQHGYIECLQKLLASEAIDLHACTEDNKTMIGQKFAVYTAGGESVMHVAVNGCRLDVLTILLSSSSSYIATTSTTSTTATATPRKRMISQKDSFGVTPLESAMEQLCLTPERNVTRRANLIEMIKMLYEFEKKATGNVSYRWLRVTCEESGESSEEILAGVADCTDHSETATTITEESILASLPPLEEVKEAHSIRKKLLYRRILAGETEAKISKEAIDAANLAGYESYRLERPTSEVVYCRDLVQSNMAWTLHPGFSMLNIIEPIPKVYCFPLFCADFVKLIREELLFYQSIAITHPELSLPLDIRHDGNWGNIQQCGFQPLLCAIESLIQPIVTERYPYMGKVHCYHAFLTQNSSDKKIGDSAATFKTHRDKSQLTINVCLHKTADTIGSSVVFFQTPPSFDPSLVPGDEFISYDYHHTVGHCVIHDGTQWHRTQKIDKGERDSLIIWAKSRDRDDDDPEHR